MRQTRLLLTVFVVSALAACSQQPAAPAAGSAAPAAEAAPELTGPITFTPARLTTCDPGQVVTVHWDVRDVQPVISAVELYAGTLDNQTLFAAGGNIGDAATGPWAMPGAVFSLRDKDTGAELAEVAIPGPECR